MGTRRALSPFIRCAFRGAEWSAAMKSSFFLWLGVLVILIVYQLIFHEQSLSLEYDYNSGLGYIGGNASTEIVALSKCSLAEFPNSGWTTEIIEKLNAYFDPTKGCDRNFTTFTVLGDNGTVWLNTEKDEATQVKCKARALYWKTEREYSSGEWQIVQKGASSVVFDSDFVHTSCHESEDENDIVEDFVHFQMWDDSSKSVKTGHKNKSIDEKPNVFMFVLDSVSYSQALRSLPKTIELLNREFDSVAFKHMNKVAENSHPNGMAFLMGKLLKDVDRSMFGMGKEKADWNQTEACQHYFDQHPFILKEFTERGYKSAMAEDTLNGVFTYLCKGFENPPITHYSRPFQIHYKMDAKKSAKFMGENQCLEPHNFLLNYLTKFMNAYKESPKISMLWSVLSHDESDDLYRLDAQLYEYFKQHRDLFDKSFVYLMGDHGMRIGEITKTWIGQREINNPMLFVSVPRHLRARVNPILMENSDQLMTPFDVHASLVDILNNPQLKAKTSSPKVVRGQSIFRPFQGDRSCRTLPIPIQFCLCEWNNTASKNEDVNIEIGIGAVQLLNEKLEMLKITDKCKSFTLKEVNEVNMMDRTNGLTEIRFATSQCGAEFKTIVRVGTMENGRLNVTAGSNFFTRWDAYGDTSYCSNREQLRPLCCCKWWSVIG